MANSPIDVLIAKVKGKPMPADAEQSDEMDTGKEARLDAVRKLITAVHANRPEDALAALETCMDLYEKSEPDEVEMDD